MKIHEVSDRMPGLVETLLSVWESSVRATHHFLSDPEIMEIREYVPVAIAGSEHLVITEDDDGNAVAFMGIQDRSLEMLFVRADERGKGIGRQLMEKAINEYSVDSLAVNEQNPQARGFYEHMGFRVIRRTDLDEQGNPYPILYMKLQTDTASTDLCKTGFLRNSLTQFL